MNTNEWISFKDQRPKTGDHVLMTDAGKDYIRVYGWSEHPVGCMTHWMLITPPLKPDPFEEYWAELPMWGDEDDSPRRWNGRCIVREDIKHAFNAGREAERNQK